MRFLTISKETNEVTGCFYNLIDATEAVIKSDFSCEAVIQKVEGGQFKTTHQNDYKFEYLIMFGNYDYLKTIAEAEAATWQCYFNEYDYYYDELAEFSSYFTKLGEVFDLTEEFKENGVI